MSSPGFARVAIDSPLPQLDRLFEYRIPSNLLQEVKPGIRIRVPFGRGKSLLDAFVIELVETPDFDGKLAEVAEVVSPAQVLSQTIYQLARNVADRQAATLSDVMKLAIPNRSVAVEKKWLAISASPETSLVAKENSPVRATKLIEPRSIENTPAWVSEFITRIRLQIAKGRSAIIAVPDYRDQAVLLAELAKSDLAAQVVDYSSQQTKSVRYSAFLRCLLPEPLVVVGSRAAIYAPLQNLGEIIIWDDGDSSHQEPTSPYSHTREVAMVRQKLEQCDLFFASHARSSEVQRLVEMGYLQDESDAFPIPRLAITETAARVDGTAWALIRDAIELGAVLVQVSSRGTSTSAYCASCAERALCSSCHGPLWLDGQGHPRCRWCNSTNLNFTCGSCKNRTLRHGRAGSTRTSAEFGKAFPGAQIIESNGENRLEWITPGKRIVIATPGAEPRVQGGYHAIVLLDCNELMSRDSLKATEEAVRLWSNAIALLSQNGRAIAVGLAGQLGKKLALWSQVDIAAAELATRRELRFPPALRMASISGEAELLQKVSAILAEDPRIEVLGPMPIQSRDQNGQDWRSLLRFEYSHGAELAHFLKAQVLLLTAGSKRVSAKSGRAQRPIRIKMDDAEVI